MGFANALALWFLGLFIPVILLYLLKQRRRRVQVSTLLFWDKILRDEQTVTSITKLKKILSLLLQLLFIALLTFALARPLLSERLTGARRIVLFLDTSASMAVKEGDTTRFELAREKALDVVRGLAMGDTLMIVSAAAEPDIVRPFTDSKRELREALREIEFTHGATDFKRALMLLDQLPPDERETSVYLITDGAFEPVPFTPPARTRFAFLKVGEARDNIGITAFQLRPLPSAPRDFQVHVEVTNQTDEERTVPLELRIGGRLVDAYELTIAAGQSITRTFRQFSGEGGEVEVILDVDDSFPLDDRAFAALPPPRPVKARLVTENNLFLESALRTDEGVDLTIVPPAEYADDSSYEVTIFSGWTPPNTPRGNSIFVADWPDDLGLEKRGVLEKPLFTEWDREHPINRHLVLKNVSIEKAVSTQAGSNFVQIASSFDDPLVLLREDSRNKTMVVTFDTLSTDLPLRVAFPIMIANAIRYLAGIETGERWQNPALGEILTGAELDRYMDHRSDGGDAGLIHAVLAPDGSRVTPDGGRILVSVNKVGFYRVENTNEVQTPLFAANLSSRNESTIKPSDVLPLRSDPPVPEIKDGFRLGFEPWFFLVLVGLLLSTVEWGLFHRRVIE